MFSPIHTCTYLYLSTSIHIYCFSIRKPCFNRFSSGSAAPVRIKISPISSRGTVLNALGKSAQNQEKREKFCTAAPGAPLARHQEEFPLPLPSLSKRGGSSSTHFHEFPHQLHLRSWNLVWCIYSIWPSAVQKLGSIGADLEKLCSKQVLHCFS